MNKRMVVSVSMTLALFLTACGGSSAAPSTADFSSQLDDVCRTIGRGIGNLDTPKSLDDVGSNASDASALYEDGLNDLKKLKIPTGDQEFAGDVKDLIASFEDQLDTLDAIAKAAKENDQDGVDTKISKLSDQAADSNDLADSLDVSRCQLDPVFDAATTTTTTTTTTDVPFTLPVETVPADTFPPDTIPLDTAPFDSAPPDTNKVIESTADLVPFGDTYTFQNAPDDAIAGFRSLLDAAPSMLAQSGKISGVDVLDLDGNTMGRIFAFESDTNPLTPGSLEEVTPFFTADIATTPLTVGTEAGVTWTDTDGTAYFLLGETNVLLWALAPTEALLQPALKDWGESVSQ
jgi:hypothetical protein